MYSRLANFLPRDSYHESFWIGWRPGDSLVMVLLISVAMVGQDGASHGGTGHDGAGHGGAGHSGASHGDAGYDSAGHGGAGHNDAGHGGAGHDGSAGQSCAL